jgi:hypothetical protein
MQRHKRTRRGSFGESDGILQPLYNLRKGLSGDSARDYVDRYIVLKARAMNLEKYGLKVRIVLPDFPRRPMLVIEK